MMDANIGVTMNIRTLALTLSLLCMTPAMAFAQDPTVADVADIVEVEVSDVDIAEVVEAVEAEVIEVPEEVPETLDEAEEVFMALLATGKAGKWSIFGGLVIMLLVFGLRKWVFKALSGQALAWTSALVGMAAYIALALVTGTSPVTAIFTGLTTGAMASGLWELVGRAATGKKS
jgi:hypothetical protein